MTEDTELLHEMIDERVMDEWLEKTHGHEAREEIDIDTSLTKIELTYLVDAIIEARNQAVNNGEFITLLMCYRLLEWTLDMDDEMREEYEEVQQYGPPQIMGILGEMDFSPGQ